MASRRKEDGREPRVYYRSDRMEKHSDSWFFHTREGTIEGPFSTEFEAEEALHRYIAVMNYGLLPEEVDYALEEQKAS